MSGGSGGVCPAHMDARARAVWDELAATWPIRECSSVAVEALVVQVVRMRDAQARVDEEGEMVAGPRERPQPHPALAIERASGEQVRKWLGVLREEVLALGDEDVPADPFADLDAGGPTLRRVV